VSSQIKDPTKRPTSKNKVKTNFGKINICINTHITAITVIELNLNNAIAFIIPPIKQTINP